MSATYGAIYVRNKGAQADKRPLVGDEWVAYEVASDLLPGSDGELMSKVLSEKYGEAIYVFDDEGNDQHQADALNHRKVLVLCCLYEIRAQTIQTESGLDNSRKRDE